MLQDEQVMMPEWNAGDKPAALRAFTSWLNDTARAQFLGAGTSVEILFFLNDEGLANIAPVPPKVERSALSHAIREQIRTDNLYGVVHVAEAWTYMPRRANDHTYRQVVEGEMTVSQLKEEDRTEALVVHMESRDGACLLLVNPITRDGARVGLAEAIAVDQPAEGRVAGWFRE